MNTPDIAPEADHEDQDLLDALAALPTLRPANGLTTTFRARLAAQPRRRVVLSPFLATGIAAALLLVASTGWWHERQLRLNESQALHSKLEVALQSLSTATRIQAINASVAEGSHGDAVEQALVTALLTDQSTNVRMAAAEALGRIARPEALQEAVRRALAQENSPFVQMTLLGATDHLPATQRQAAIAPILAREHIDPMVVNDARERMNEPARSDSR